MQAPPSQYSPATQSAWLAPFAAAGAALLGTAAVACLGPALAARRLDSVEALTQE